MRRLLPAALACAALAVSACGGDGASGRPEESASLLLDFQPNAVHVGIYVALARDFTGAEGVDLSVRVPGQSTDAVKQLLADRIDFAILDIHDLALAREKDRDLVGVMAISEDPLASVIAQPGVRTPKDLEGKRVGVSGLPSDDAVLSSIVRGAGGDPARVRRTTIGFDAIPAILSRKVAGATAFWNAEGVALSAKRPVKIFKVDDFGAPSYPELVLTTTREKLQDDPKLVQATVTALQRGYREAIADPDTAIAALVSRNPGLDRSLVSRELDAVQPTFQAASGGVGTFDAGELRRWAAWEQRFGIVKALPEVALMFAAQFAARGEAQTPC